MGPRGLKINNRTEYRTDDLRRFFLSGIRECGLSYKLLIDVVYARTDEVNGQASYPWGNGDDWMKFALPRKKISMLEFAQVFLHEAQHRQGLKHRDMVHWQDLFPTWQRGIKIRYRKAARRKR